MGLCVFAIGCIMGIVILDVTCVIVLGSERVNEKIETLILDRWKFY